MRSPGKPRRQAKVVEWKKAGYTTAQIADGLGVATSTVSQDASAMARFLDGVPIIIKRRLPDPEPYDWRSEPEPVIEAPYRVASPVVAVRTFLAQTLNAANRLAFNVADAAAAGDEDWYVRSQADVADAIRRLEEMQAVLTDAEARRSAARNGRDDLTRRARSVRPLPGRQSGLPPRGAGVRPGRVYADLLAFEYAGVLVGADELEQVAVRQNTNVPRVESALAELREAGCNL